MNENAKVFCRICTKDSLLIKGLFVFESLVVLLGSFYYFFSVD